ncbi:MAG TPA: hypothetical protein VF618_02770 [Thermoanaerobaculia bacterium]
MTHNNRQRFLGIIAAAVVSMLPVAANATIARAVTFDEKVERAAAIVHGRVVKTESRWDASRTSIVTYSTFRVEKAMKGQASQELTIVTPGGSIDGVHQSSIGIPAFEEGGEHVIFVRNTAVGPTVLYADQGAYDVVDDGREKIVRPVASEAVRVDTQRGMAVAPEEARPLRAFEGAIQASMRQGVRNRMEIIQEKERQEKSLWSQLNQNRGLFALAILGIALATWRLLKK